MYFSEHKIIQNNPVEARNMLLQNPQLAYALLQAQVVMRIVNPDNALRMLHPKTNTAKPLAQPRLTNLLFMLKVS